jgi:predicted ATPase
MEYLASPHTPKVVRKVVATTPEFGEWLRRFRRARDLTRAELAAQLGYSVQTVQGVEARGQRPSQEFAGQVAVLLGLSPAARAAFVNWARGVATATHQPGVELGLLLKQLHQLARPPRPPASRRTASSLPAPATRLIGRIEEQTALLRWLDARDVRLVTLTGPPGVGKTRLAVAAVAEASESGLFPDGVSFIPLATIEDPTLVVPAIAQRLRLRGPDEGGGRGRRDAGRSEGTAEPLAAALHRKRLLLVLDNVEQVRAAGPLLVDLLEGAAGLKLLVTSREPLGVYGEHEFTVPPLALPGLHPFPPLGALAGVPSVALFVARVRAVRPSFALTPDNAPAVAALCHRLDGLPLAIELAAGRSKRLAPAALLAQLAAAHAPLALLSGGPRDRPGRQQTLRAAIAWSYNLLSPAEQRLFRRLSVFAGGCTRTAAEAVCAPSGAASASGPAPTAGQAMPEPVVSRPAAAQRAAVWRGIEALLDKHLLRELEPATGDPPQGATAAGLEDAGGAPAGPRVGMLETIRAYALERLQASGEAERVRRRHAHYFLAMAERGRPRLDWQDAASWLDQLERDYDNLRAALGWCAGRPAEAELLVRLCCALSLFWHIRGPRAEGRRWLEQALSVPPALGPTHARATLLGAFSPGWTPEDHGLVLASPES